MTPEPIALKFYDHHRQRYGDIPLPRGIKAEFMVGDYGEGSGGTGTGGEFKITLIDLPNGPDRERSLHPHLEVFGDANGSLLAAIQAGLLEQIKEPVADRDEFSRRLLDLGFEDLSEHPLGSAVAAAMSTGRVTRELAAALCRAVQVKRLDAIGEREPWDFDEDPLANLPHEDVVAWLEEANKVAERVYRETRS